MRPSEASVDVTDTHNAEVTGIAWVRPRLSSRPRTPVGQQRGFGELPPRAVVPRQGGRAPRCVRRSVRDCHLPCLWLGLSLPMRGGYADHIHLWADGIRARASESETISNRAASRAACQ